MILNDILQYTLSIMQSRVDSKSYGQPNRYVYYRVQLLHAIHKAEFPIL